MIVLLLIAINYALQRFKLLLGYRI